MSPRSTFVAPATGGAAARSRPPVWLLAVAAAFAAYFLLLLRADLRRPEASGIRFTIDRGQMTLESVHPGSPADAAGLQAADRVLAVNGRSIQSRLDWLSFTANVDISRPVSYELERANERVDATLRLKPAPPAFWLSTPGATLATARLAQLATLVLAFMLLFKRPFDRHARVGAWLLATVAVYSLALPYGLAADWRALPWPIGLPLWMPYASSLAVAPIILTFFAAFPHPLVRTPLAWTALWIPALPVLAHQLQYAAWMIYTPERAATWEGWTGIALAVSAAYAIAAVVAVVVGYRRETDLTERRRVRVLACGALAAMLGVLPIAIDYWRAGTILGSTVFESRAAAVGLLAGLALPISFAYAILRHRLFDVSFLVRRSLQYALTRQVLVSIVPLAAAAFLIDLFLNRQIPVGGILEARGWMYAGLAGLAVVAHVRRRTWLDGLDRRFFRERYNAQRLLRSIGDDVRRAPEMPAYAPRIVARIEEALHPELAALLVRHPGEDHYAVLAVAPAGTPLAALRGDSTIAGLLSLLQRPLRIPIRDDDDLIRQLPAQDLDWLRRHQLELLIPIRFGSGWTEAFFAFGLRRSEEPYSAEDEDLLTAIGHGMALLVPRKPRSGFEECPTCGACCEVGSGQCPHDGSQLTRQAVPRVLADRYRLLQRIGRGGMGTVYAAEDFALRRRVAVKLVREDFRDPAGPDRFLAEARIGAAFSHPNAVTVFDIGLTPAGQTFFVMELLEGVTLHEELKRTRRLAPARTVGILKGIGSAVSAAHARQMIHRDLKPENIFLCQTAAGEVPKVLDFGLAKALEMTGITLTLPGFVAGTPRYMAPERLLGGDASPDWDLWSLAVMALEMLTGAAIMDVPPGGAPRLDHLPGGIRQVFAAALSRDPLDRPTSVDDFIDALERALVDCELPT